jgi:transcriptional regulator with XRE-family HTH domain
MNIKIKIGRRIKKLRKMKGISQLELSHLAELDRTYINSIENGRRNVSIVNIEKIANAFGMSVFEFFKSEDFK